MREANSKALFVLCLCFARALRGFERLLKDVFCAQGSKELADPTDPLNVAPGLAKIHDKLNQKNAQNQEVDYFGRKTDPAKMADLNKVRHDIHDTLTNKFV